MLPVGRPHSDSTPRANPAPTATEHHPMTIFTSKIERGPLRFEHQMCAGAGATKANPELPMCAMQGRLPGARAWGTWVRGLGNQSRQQPQPRGRGPPAPGRCVLAADHPPRVLPECIFLRFLAKPLSLTCVCHGCFVCFSI